MAAILRHIGLKCITASLFWPISVFAAVPHDFGRENLYLWIDSYDINAQDLDNDTDIGAVYGANGLDPALAVGTRFTQITDKSAARHVFTAVVANRTTSWPIKSSRAIQFSNFSSFLRTPNTVIPAGTNLTSTGIMYAGSLSDLNGTLEDRAYAFHLGTPYSYIENGYYLGTLDRTQIVSRYYNFSLSPNSTKVVLIGIPKPLQDITLSPSIENTLIIPIENAPTFPTVKVRVGNIEDAREMPDATSTDIFVFEKNIRQSDGYSFIVPNDAVFTLAGGYTPDPFGPSFRGLIAELLIAKKEFTQSQAKLMRAYFDARHPKLSGTPYFHLGGIGTAGAGDSVTRGTSAGLALSMDGSWSAGSYLTAKLPERMPSRGLTKMAVPASVPQRSPRVWIVERTGAAAMPTKFWFNLELLGMPESYGKHMYLLHRASPTDNFTTVAEARATDRQVEFALADPQAGEYTVGTSVGYDGFILSVGIDGIQVLSEGVEKPKVIPGSIVRVSIALNAFGDGMSDLDSVSLQFPVPQGGKLYLGDFAGPGKGPVIFEPKVTPSLLSLPWKGLNDMTDAVDFSNDGGATWTYVPTLDSQKADSAINMLRLRPKGYLKAAPLPDSIWHMIYFGVVVK